MTEAQRIMLILKGWSKNAISHLEAYADMKGKSIERVLKELEKK